MNKRNYFEYEIKRIDKNIEFREGEIEQEKKRIKKSEKIIKNAKEDIQTYKEVRADLFTLYNNLDENG
ncbi:hypothetical protein [Mammaliicoccus sciuri]|uniref:hypothetical protein n=1 Tax=Mammaliicoccus sciuri TaxID=1296 RepID=UPI003F571BA6